MNIKNVLHVFSLAKNLLLMCQLTQNGSSIEFHHTFCSIKLFTLRGKPIHLQCPQVDSLSQYTLDLMPLLLLQVTSFFLALLLE